MGIEAKQRTSFRCFFTGFRFKSKVDLQDRVYLDYVPCDKIVKFVFVISQRKARESKEDLIIVKLSSIYQTGSYLGSFRGSRELYCKFAALKLGRILALHGILNSLCNSNFHPRNLIIKLVEIAV